MSRTTPLRVGLIGLGAVATRFYKTFNEHPDTVIAAVCDVNGARAKQVAAENGNVPWYTDHRELLKQDDLDVIYIGVPPKYHHRIALDTLQAGKHILCEKPLANSLEEAEDMARAAAVADVVTAMHFPTYYGAAGAAFANVVHDGFLGELRRLEVQMHFHQWPREWQMNPWVGGREQGGFTREVMVHYIHLIEAIFGPIASVTSHLDFPEDESKSETGLIARMTLEDGTTVLVNGLTDIGQQELISFTAYGTEGTLSLRNWSELHIAGFGHLPQRVELPQVASTPILVSELVRAIDGEPADLIDFAFGARIQKTLEALLQSK